MPSARRVRQILAPVVFIEPFEGANVRVLDFDPRRTDPREAEPARDAETAVIWRRSALVQDPRPGTAGAILYLPVYAGGGSRTAEERGRAILGWVNLAFRVDDGTAGLLGTCSRPRLEIQTAHALARDQDHDPDGKAIALDQPVGRLRPRTR